MSTEHQRYSTENQADAIRKYADQKGLEIVRTYADEGKSDPRFDGRDFIKPFIRDVQTGKRFQDANEGAHYEYPGSGHRRAARSALYRPQTLVDVLLDQQN